MTDLQNNRPQLSLEEELDVLEAVWKVGKEKGLDLLRPEQKKKLIDSGRVFQKDVEIDTNSPEISPEILQSAIRQVVAEMFATVEQFYPDEIAEVNWQGLSEEKKTSIRSNLFYMKYGTSPQFFAYDLLNYLGAR